jgi:ATP-dependent DNA helicase RecQ
MKPQKPASLPIDRARQLRSRATVPEQKLWSHLRNRRLAGLKFRRQHPIGPFVVDFYCDDHRLILEIDGPSHEGRAEEDLRRQQWLLGQGFFVLRAHNEDVLFDIDTVLRGVLKACGINPD